MAKYNIEEIEYMKMSGMTLTEISGKLGTTKTALSKYLSRHGKPFSSLKKKCKYCGKVFQPNEFLTGDFCSSLCEHYNKLEVIAKNRNKYYKKYGNKHPDLNRDDKNIQYHNALWFLEAKKETCICPLCGNSDENEFEICRGELICKKCQLIQE